MTCAEKNNAGPEWSNEISLQLIDEYEKFPILWDAKDPQHFSENKKADAWEIISLNMRIAVPHCVQKINSLLGSFRREKKKGKKSVGTGKARKEIYISQWYAFERMHYLLDKDEPRATMDTELEDIEEEEVSSVQTSSNLDTAQNVLDEGDQNLNQDGPAAVVTKSHIAPVPPKQHKRKASDIKDDARLEEAFRILKESTTKKEIPPDYCTTYSQHVVNKLRNYTITTRAQVENAINNILFQADMGRYDNPHTNSFTQHQNTAAVFQYPITQYPGDYSTVPTPLTSPSYMRVHPVQFPTAPHPCRTCKIANIKIYKYS